MIAETRPLVPRLASLRGLLSKILKTVSSCFELSTCLSPKPGKADPRKSHNGGYPKFRVYQDIMTLYMGSNPRAELLQQLVA